VICVGLEQIGCIQTGNAGFERPEVKNGIQEISCNAISRSYSQHNRGLRWSKQVNIFI